jgi:hypothetical protein
MRSHDPDYSKGGQEFLPLDRVGWSSLLYIVNINSRYGRYDNYGSGPTEKDPNHENPDLQLLA